MPNDTSSIEFCVQGLNQQSYTLKQYPSKSVFVLKKQLETQYGLPVSNQRLVFNGKPLTNARATLKDIGLNHGSTIFLLGHIKSGETFRIKVMQLDRESCFLVVSHSDTILSIKQKLQERFGTAVDQQRLAYDGKTLMDNSASIQHYGISPNCTIYLLSRLMGGGGSLPSFNFASLEAGEKRDSLTKRHLTESLHQDLTSKENA